MHPTWYIAKLLMRRACPTRAHRVKAKSYQKLNHRDNWTVVVKFQGNMSHGC